MAVLASNRSRDVEQRLCALDSGIFKILVTHHPFDLPLRFDRSELAGKARLAMGRLAQSVDLLLAGHMHISHAGSTAVRYKLKGRSAIFVQAGTATSTRGRGELNSFNLIRIDSPRLLVEKHQWDPEQMRYLCIGTDQFPIGGTSVCAAAQAPDVSDDEVELPHPSVSDGMRAAE